MLEMEKKETGKPRWVKSGGGGRGLQHLPGQPLLFLQGTYPDRAGSEAVGKQLVHVKEEEHNSFNRSDRGNLSK